MKQSVNVNQFMDAFEQMGRKDQYSYEGKKALFEWLEQYEEDTDIEQELDVIALCVDFSEHDNALECAQEYGYEEVVDLEPHGSVDLLEVAELENKQATEWLEERTIVIPVGDTGRVIIQNF